MANNSLVYSLCILFIVIILVWVLKVNIGKKIVGLLENGQYDELDKELDKTTTRMLIKTYNRENMRLNSYIMQKKNKKIDEQFDLLWDIYKSPANNQEFLTKMFNHYLYRNDKKQCKKILSKMEETLKTESIVNESKMLYQIFFEKSYAYIDPLVHQMDNLPKEQKSMAAYYVAVQYKNKGDISKQKEYEALSKKYLDE